MPIDVTVGSERGATDGVVAHGVGPTAHRVNCKDQVVHLLTVSLRSLVPDARRRLCVSSDHGPLLCGKVDPMLTRLLAD